MATQVMAKKRTKKKTAERRMSEQLNLRCLPGDRVNFERAAEAEGFTNRTAWMLYHLRRIAKETLKGED